MKAAMVLCGVLLALLMACGVCAQANDAWMSLMEPSAAGDHEEAREETPRDDREMWAHEEWAPTADTSEDAAVTDFADAVTADHTIIKELAQAFHRSSGDAQRINARLLVNALWLHDRRERAVLHPLVTRITDSAPHMTREHNEMALALLRVCAPVCDFANSSVLSELWRVASAALRHNEQEEREALPAVRAFLHNRPRDNKELARLWSTITATGAPLVPELVAAQHVTVLLLMGAYEDARHAAAADDDEKTAARLAHKLTRAIRDHMRCETAVFYPLVLRHLRELPVDAARVRRLRAAHNTMAAMLKALASQDVHSTTAQTMMNKLLNIKKAHMNQENLLLSPLRTFLLRHPQANVEAVTTYLECETQSTA